MNPRPIHLRFGGRAGAAAARPEPARAGVARARQSGSVLIIVIWVAFGLVSLALYFGHSMMLESRAAEDNAAGLAAEEAIEGAARYICYQLTNQSPSTLGGMTQGSFGASAGSQALQNKIASVIATNGFVIPGIMPDTNSYFSAAVPVGEATFWIIGRSDGPYPVGTPVFGLVDEAGKLNLNTANLDMLETLPRMTPQLAASIIDWRDSDDTPTQGGAESDTYLQLNPGYYCKNTNFDTIEELHWVMGATPDILYGEDLNRNGVLDPNENDGNVSPPDDNSDGQLDPGILEFVTVYSREPNKQVDGSARINLNAAGQPGLRQLLQNAGITGQKLTRAMAAPPGAGYSSLVQYFIRSGLSLDEFAAISDSLSVTNSQYITGLVNINTAPAPVLACLPGIGLDKAASVVAYRQVHPDQLATVAWITQVLDQPSALQAGPYITTRSYQYSADIAAVGPFGRGYRRTLFVFDTSDGSARVVYRRDLSALGWALGNRQLTLMMAKVTR